MGKSTLVLIALAALGLGALIGVSLVDDQVVVGRDVGEVGAACIQFKDHRIITIGLDVFDRAES